MNFLTNKLVGAFTRLSFANGVTIGFAVLSGVASARFYGPSEIGITATYLVSTTIAAYLVGGRYDYVLFRADLKEDPRLVLLGSACFAVANTLLLSTLAVSLCILFNPVEFLDPLPDWVYLAPISVLSAIGWTTVQSCYNAEGDYTRLSNYRMLFSGFSSGFILTFSLLAVPGGIIIGGLLAQLTAVAWALSGLMVKRQFRNISFEQVRAFLVRFRDHPFKIAPTWVINILAQQAPVYVLAAFFSPAVAGLYTIANKASYAPVQLLSAAAGDLFREAAAKREKTGQLRKYFIFILTSCALLGVPLYSLIIFFGVPLLEYILGSEWSGLRETLAVTAVLGYFQFTLTPLDKVALAFGRSTYVFIWNISRLLGVFLVGYLCLQFGAASLEFLMWFVGFTCVLYTVDLLYGYRLLVRAETLKD